MLLRPALKKTLLLDPIWRLAILGLLFSACQPSDQAAVDKLNAHAYACHYRSVDSTAHYAREAFAQAVDYPDGRAEALNNLAFVSLVRMEYQEAERQLNEATALTSNQIELLVTEVQQMRLCQRRSNNRAFYEHRERAFDHLKRINEERAALSPRLLQRLTYAESELAIVNSTYYYYVGLERQSVEALLAVNADEVRHDTAQYLNYLYNVGAGGIITDGTPEDIYNEEMDFLHRCLSIASRFGYPYFEANAKEAIAEHTKDLQLAEEALRLFTDYGDVYQIAGAHRTLASCYHALGDDLQALDHLEKALSDTAIYQAPDLVASIREQLSVAYSAINDKPQSDYNRNIYIDLQEQTRQDRELEARAGILDQSAKQLNWMILAVLGAILLLLFLLWLFNHLNRKNKESHLLDDLLEQKAEELHLHRLQLEKSERRHLEQRAKVSLVNSITPFIDRILYAVDHLDGQDSRDTVEYIRELTDKINEQNDLLTQWIQLRQGELSLHIESFPLQPLFDLIFRGKASFDMKGVTLTVVPTDATVKADRVLTLFMLNTLADNARKFTDRGGSVTVSALEQADYVELSVADTGCGMSPEQLGHVFDHKTFSDVRVPRAKGQESHGFGLANCKGIIEKYRKMSQLFSVCHIAAESEQGRGTRLFFRLPRGKMMGLLAALTWLLAGFHPQPACAQTLTAADAAHVFADSAYFSNINGHYQRTLQFADSCRRCLNQHYLAQRPKGQLLMTANGDTSVTPPEIQWLHDSLDMNWQVILDIRNESAVAALALHEWALYEFNNKVYTQLFKELSADATLSDYVRQLQQSQQNKRIAVILLIVILLLIVPAYYMLYYRHRLDDRHRRERMQLDNIEMADDELRRTELEQGKLHVANAVLDNCLSALKHETMYYPSRIRQLTDSGDVTQLAEVTRYYRELYGILSEQANRQVDQLKLHVGKLQWYGQPVIGDEGMLRYLFELLNAREGAPAGSPGSVDARARDDQYAEFVVHGTPRTAFDSLLCRQIVRDHGEATHRRGCGISVDNQTTTIILPRHNG